jgi:immunoglobulin superfamily member 9B
MSYPNRSPSVHTQNGSWFHLSVDGSTLLKIPPVNQTVLEYSTAFFACTVKNSETMFVSWYKDQELLSTHHDLASRIIMGADGSILISPTLMTDLGVYSCKVKNILNEEENAQAYLNVQCTKFSNPCTFITVFCFLDKAKVIFAPKEVFFAHGHQA